MAVKALDWEAPTTGPDEYALVANTKIMEFRYEVRRCEGVKTRFTVTRSCDIQPFAWRDTIEAAKAAAQSDYEARIRSAVSAQVQDVAETEADIVERMVKSMRDPFPTVNLSISRGIDGWRELMRDALRAAAPAKQEGGHD